MGVEKSGKKLGGKKNAAQKKVPQKNGVKPWGKGKIKRGPPLALWGKKLGKERKLKPPKKPRAQEPALNPKGETP